MGKKLTLEEIHNIGKERGGKCLSNEYIGIHHKLKWECKEGHIWEARLNDIKNNGTWCTKCAKVKRRTIEEMYIIAEGKGGKCLSNEYINNRVKLKWECKEGHIWEATPNDVIDGTWCPSCQKYTIWDAKKLAEDREGKCLSAEYINNSTKLKWECKEGHIWEAPFSSIKSKGYWCPHCFLKGENLCRLIFEEIFKKPFIKVRPAWLINPETNRKLELDGYCEELKIAFEYNGVHHYKINSHFKTTQDRLDYNIKKDNIKLKICKEKGINLIVIPQLYMKVSDYTITVDNLKDYIIEKIYV